MVCLVTQNVKHAGPGVAVGALKRLGAGLLALGAVVLGEAAVHDAALVGELAADVADDSADRDDGGDDGEELGAGGGWVSTCMFLWIGCVGVGEGSLSAYLALTTARGAAAEWVAAIMLIVGGMWWYLNR